MIGAWVRRLAWRPLEAAFRRTPLVPLRAQVTEPVPGVLCIRIDNLVTKAVSRLGGGYDYSVSYVIDRALIVDTGFPWARQCLDQTLKRLGMGAAITAVVNTHHHEDHVGNNDLFAATTALYAHPLALAEIRYPSERAWYRNFMFGPPTSSRARPIPETVSTGERIFTVLHTPGHSPDHVCLYEPSEGWLFSGDLYIAADIDSQLREVDGPAWIRSLEQVIALRPRCLFDAHGLTLTDAESVEEILTRKRDFLLGLQGRVREAEATARSLAEVVAFVFDQKSAVNHLSFHDGWLALLTGSDMSRTHLVRSFLAQETDETQHHHGQPQ
ncbi:MBL fold hydrolase [Capsulimonas corticalis]|uniref:MBL fold hydrolase n=1 Tax=Capsulimonas corticalis TaxID=2219043 RepID=A0A402D293_9BACT|nr:MBL fold metallo-hydrolase [Capsulimonas corticalis]BDI30033.1 MBL fold hydrolase [Capsulimonas corticalis]